MDTNMKQVKVKFSVIIHGEVKYFTLQVLDCPLNIVENNKY